MSKSKPTSEWPVPEYLNLVGYFRADVKQSVAMLRRLLDLIHATFGDGASFEKDVQAYFKATEPVPLASDRWKLESEPALGAWRLFELRRGEDLRAVTASLDFFPDDVRTNTASFLQVRKRPERFYDFDNVWHLNYDDSHEFIRHQQDCRCLIGVSTDLFPPRKVVESKVAAHFSDEVVRIWLEHGDLYYALMSSYDYRYDIGGWAYLFGQVSAWNAHFCIENEMWAEAKQSRRDKVRGVYNGQYLSPVHLEKLGGKEKFVSDLLKVRDRRSDLLTDLGDKGLILRLTPSPIDPTSKGINQGCAEIATWVFRRFRDAGLFCR